MPKCAKLQQFLSISRKEACSYFVHFYNNLKLLNNFEGLYEKWRSLTHPVVIFVVAFRS